ncbi:bacterio-opsin activator domain-containing protein [Halobacteriales archaeon Cl-PHB]
MSEQAPPPRAATATEVEFRFDDAAYPFVGLTTAGTCELDLVRMIPRANDGYAEFFEVHGDDPENVLAEVLDVEGVEVHLLETSADGGLVEFEVAEDCPAVALGELGALPRTVRGRNGRGWIVADIPERRRTGDVVDAFLDRFGAAEFVAKRERQSASPALSRATFERVLEDRLTDRQREVLEAALDAGYYEWPRETTGTEIAAELGIASATFSQHVQAAERKVLTALFDP